jgi:hypothetical protein
MDPRHNHELSDLSGASESAPCSSLTSRRSQLRWVALALASFAVSFASGAAATPEYPLVIDSTLDVSCPRPNSRCLICHTTSRGGQGTAVQPFARTLYDYGLVRGRDTQGLERALFRLGEATDDSDADGVFDEDELRLCGNPSGEELGIGPEYGCDGAHLARNANSDLPFVLAAVTVAGLLLRTRSLRLPARRRDPPHR